MMISVSDGQENIVGKGENAVSRKQEMQVFILKWLLFPS